MTEYIVLKQMRFLNSVWEKGKTISKELLESLFSKSGVNLLLEEEFIKEKTK